MSSLQEQDLREWLTIARELSWGAADILLSYAYGDSRRGGNLDLKIREQAGGIVTAADFAVNDFLLDRLQKTCGSENFGYLSEETYKLQPSDKPIDKPFVWIIDPLDGTRDFTQHTGEYSVHLALIHQHRPVLAVVASPSAGKLYYALHGSGTFVETRSRVPVPISVSLRSHLPDLTVVIHRNRSSRMIELLQRLPFQQHRSIGSIGCKIAAIVEQQADLYITLSGKSAAKDWDFAAPDLILTEAGGRITHLDGTPLLYNRGDVSQWGAILASNGQRHEELCHQAAEILAEIEDRY